MTDIYENGAIYKIVCKDLLISDMYIGSTCNLNKRESDHISCCNNTTSPKYNYHLYNFIRNNGGWGNWSFILIKYFPCKTRYELEREERVVMENLKATLNLRKPAKSPEDHKKYQVEYYKENIDKIKEYYKENSESLKEYQTEYREKNKDKIKEYQDEYYKENAEDIKEYQNVYYEKHKDKAKEYYKNNKEKMLADSKERYTLKGKTQNIRVSCDCGGDYLKNCRYNHNRTLKHLEYLKTKTECEVV